MLSKKMEKALNEQLNAELFSSYLYLSMAAYFEGRNLDGFGSWMKVQAQEELAHGMKFYEFINSRGGKVTLDAIEAPQTKWDSPLDAFVAAEKHEQHISKLINDLVNQAVKESDNASHQFLMWFVAEQVEEEESVGRIVEHMKMITDSPSGLFMMDRELGSRPPIAAE